MKRKNKLLYTLTYVVIIIIFLVIYLSGTYLKNIVFIDDILKQPINNIRNIIKEKNEEGQKEENDNKKNNVKPNSESPIKYVYNEDDLKGNYIYLVNQFPMKDEIGKELDGEYKRFDFRLEFKKAALGLYYDVTLEKMEKSDIDDEWIKVYLESNKTGLKESFRETGRIKTFNNYAPYSGKSNEIILYQGIVTASDVQKGYKDFTLRMWISEDVKVVNENYEEKTIVARVNVYAMGNR